MNEPLDADLERARKMWKKVCCLTFGEKYIEEMEDPDVLKIIAAHGKQERDAGYRAGVEAGKAQRDKLLALLWEARDRVTSLGFVAHDSVCSSYTTSSDDMSEHFNPEDCDCGLKQLLARVDAALEEKR